MSINRGSLCIVHYEWCISDKLPPECYHLEGCLGRLGTLVAGRAATTVKSLLLRVDS